MDNDDFWCIIDLNPGQMNTGRNNKDVFDNKCEFVW